MENSYQYLEYKSFDDNDGAIFEIQKKTYMESFKLAFDLRYYESY